MIDRDQGPTILPMPSVRRLRPPAELVGEEREAFVDVVSSVGPAHFQAADLPLLVSFSRYIVQERTADAHLRAEGLVVGSRPSPWVYIMEKASRALLVLSVRLRLSPQSRARTQVKPQGPTSYYDKLKLLGGPNDSDD
jgi:phage terminase small subunit